MVHLEDTLLADGAVVGPVRLDHKADFTVADGALDRPLTNVEPHVGHDGHQVVLPLVLGVCALQAADLVRGQLPALRDLPGTGDYGHHEGPKEHDD